MPSNHSQDSKDVLTEYEFDYKQAKTNRFVTIQKRTAVVLDEDVAQFLTTPESMDKILRPLIE
ncbi:hypothetical protein Q2T42_12560 [Leptolyngbya boryana CZ1]|uniref:Uncharacterized protein n=1 Tax=Leptolyngbya boryana CZ1 TaxID=3060204 RepID=A0AA96X2H5_LEPBY|nr:hypothetical protein [Leptolyngbya boryana]WNZ48659.1 hypothetical protein Q2T42_12560 [Leptolyngbya boryana CZ1]